MTEAVKLHVQGLSYRRIADVLSMPKSTVAYQVRAFKRRGDNTITRRNIYDWSTVVEERQKGVSLVECARRFGFSQSAYVKAMRRLGVKQFRKKRRTIEEIVARKNKHDRRTLKRLIPVPDKCDICGQPPVWNGQPLVFVLDHKNGKNNDHVGSNLRFICPNCNSQLPTFCARNRKRLRSVTVSTSSSDLESAGAIPEAGATF